MNGARLRSGYRAALALLAAVVLSTACGSRAASNATETQAVERASPTEPSAVSESFDNGVEVFPHIHGLGYSPDGSRLLVAAHDGLRVLEGSSWSEPAGHKHDYMGFAPTEDGFYGSGHPSPVSDLVNPLGLIKSGDEGASLSQLALAGESDFHLMAVGYFSHTVYVANAQATPSLGVGLFASEDDGQTFRQAGLSGVDGQLVQIAVHPREPQTVALATSTGLYLSADRGDTFAPLIEGQPVTAVTYSPTDGALLYGFRTFNRLHTPGSEPQSLNLPALHAEDAVAHVAVNPVDPRTLAVATYHKHLLLSDDAGQTWQLAVREGRVAQP